MIKFNTIKTRGLLINLSVLLITVIMLFGICEVAVRLFYDESKNYDGRTWDEIQAVRKRKNESKGRFQKNNIYFNKDNNLSYLISNDLIEEDRYIRFDKSKVSTKKEKGKYRIIILGDSYTRYAGLKKEEDAYTNQLSNQLKKLNVSLSKNIEYEVLAFSDSGLNTNQELALLKELGMRYDPNMIILQYTDNDVGPGRASFGDSQDGKNYITTNMNVINTGDMIIPALPLFSMETNLFLFKHFGIFRFLAFKFYIIKTTNYLAALNGENESLNSIKEINKILKLKKIPFIVINFAGASTNYNFCSDLNNINKPSPLHEKLRKLSREENFLFFNMCDYVKNINSLKSELEGDCMYCHYNKKGHDIATQVLKNAIIKILGQKNEIKNSSLK